ncbi:hypothetical protein F5Y04DRAFT_269407 [Hypomontagnella monticulosa]|nr:hypothetical protein F5Y04DRAFT_269407 [Hypomontagnella monticulosa]
MSVPVQMVHVHYQGKYLKLLDSDDQTQLYSPLLGKFGGSDTEPAIYHDTNDTNISNSSTCTAAFRALSLGVTMRVRGKEVQLERSSALTRTYGFQSAGAEARLAWEADGALSGDFRLVNRADHGVLARFRNKLFSNAEVGAFEIVGDVSELLREEILISGLSVLVMVQSLNLATMVLFGASV